MSNPLTPTAKRLTEELSPLFGSNGVAVETGTTAITGDFMAIQVLADANFSLFTENGNDGSNDAMTGFVVPAGVVLYNGLGISAFTLTSGKVRAYKR